MAKYDSVHLVVVLGMHRSGTSAVSGVLESLGFSIGKNIMPSTSNNPKGYFENKSIVDLNDHLLKLSGVNWADAFSLPYGFKKGQHPLIEQSELIKRLILEEFDLSSTILIKDPRMCILLPFWQPVFKELQLNPSYIIVNRHPAGVIGSLKTRDNLSEIRSEKLWLYYNLCAELYSREDSRLFISYNQLLTDLPATVNRLMTYLPFLGTPEPGIESRINQFVEPSLNHHSTDNADGNFYFAETGKVNQLIEKACITINSNGLAVMMDEIRNGLDLANTFRPVTHEENQARITLESTDGKSFSRLFKITYDTKQLDLECEQDNHIHKIVFNPASCPCLITLSQIQLVDKENKLISTGKLGTNASFVAGNLFLFNSPFPIIYFSINPSDHPDRLIISLQYLMYGERTPYYFLETHFKHLINEENKRKLVLKETHKELLNIKKQLKDNTLQINTLQHSPAFRMVRILIKPWYLLKRFLPVLFIIY